jgi:serine/threonine protein kinase
MSLTSYSELTVSDTPDQDRVILLKQYCLGIAFLHGMDLIHRDRKPGNMATESYNPEVPTLMDYAPDYIR